MHMLCALENQYGWPKPKGRHHNKMGEVCELRGKNLMEIGYRGVMLGDFQKRNQLLTLRKLSS